MNLNQVENSILFFLINYNLPNMILLYIFIFILLMYYTYLKKWSVNRPIFYTKKDMIIIGHRGSPCLEKENTLKSFIKAFDAGVDGIELDVQILKDGKEFLLFHYNGNLSDQKIISLVSR